MNNAGSSILLLVVALTLLWFAVTDRLSRVLDAWDVLTGKEKSGLVSGPSTSTGIPSSTALRLPSLPEIGSNVQIEAV